MQCTSIFTPDYRVHDRPSTDTKEVQFDDPVSFIRVMYRSRNDLKAAASPKPIQHEWRFTELGTWAHCTAAGGSTDESVLCRSGKQGWSPLLSVAWSGLTLFWEPAFAPCFFQAAGLVSVFCAARFLRKWLSAVFTVYSWEGGAKWICSASETSWICFGLFTFCC